MLPIEPNTSGFFWLPGAASWFVSSASATSVSCPPVLLPCLECLRWRFGATFIGLRLGALPAAVIAVGFGGAAAMGITPLLAGTAVPAAPNVVGVFPAVEPLFADPKLEDGDAESF